MPKRDKAAFAGVIQSSARDLPRVDADVTELCRMLRAAACEPRLCPGSTDFTKLVGIARNILKRLGDCLEAEVWERIDADSECHWPGLGKSHRPIRIRGAIFYMHLSRMRQASVTGKDVLMALAFARQQAKTMFEQLALGLIAGRVAIHSDIEPRDARALVELLAGFKGVWKALRRKLMEQSSWGGHEI